MGPFCESDAGKTVYCSSNATRTTRAGRSDLVYMNRPDRKFCEFQFARERLTPESGANIEACRANLTERIARCALECDSCKKECTSATARDLVSAFRCSFGLPVVGLAAAFHSSDVGLDIANRHGGVRTKAQVPVPDTAFVEQYHTLVQNSVDSPIVPRGSVSCRRAHRESSTGDYVAPLANDGAYVRRRGFLVGCTTDLDCERRCGEHPIHGSPFVCSHNVTLYSHAGVDEGTFHELKEAETAAIAANRPHRKVWRPVHGADSFYVVEEPGDADFDPTDGSVGICTDTHVAYANTGCLDKGGAQAMLSLAGCPTRAMGWASFACGVGIAMGSDFVTDVGIDSSSLSYPRTLVSEAQVNGKTAQAVQCNDVVDCQRKCDFFERAARDGGLPVRL